MKRKQPDTQVEYEFLPSALEIVETPVSPLSRWVLWLIIAFLVLAIGWMFVGRIDEVAVARGKVVPAGEVKVVQPLTAGTIAELHVKNGDTVKKDQPLVSLEKSDEIAEVERFEALIASAELEKGLLQQASQGVDISAQLANKALTDEAKANLRTFYTSRQSLLAGQTAVASSSVAQQKTALSSEQSLLASREQEVKAAEMSLTTVKTTKAITDEARPLAIQDAESALAAARSQRTAQAARVEQAQAALAAAQTQLSGAQNNVAANNASVIIEQDKRLVELRTALAKAKNAVKHRTLTAPTDGVVHAMVFSTIGGVVSPAQPVLTIVPSKATLIVDAKLPNKDVGFVHVGDAVAVKVDTFSFQRYGTVKGEVIRKSADAIEDEKLGAVYTLKIKLDADEAKQRGIALTSGMTVTAEVKTGDKRIIDFFLDPILKKTDEALKVR